MIADEVGISSKEMLEIAKGLGYDVKVANSTVSETDAVKLVDYVMGGGKKRGDSSNSNSNSNINPNPKPKSPKSNSRGRRERPKKVESKGEDKDTKQKKSQPKGEEDREKKVKKRRGITTTAKVAPGPIKLKVQQAER